MRRISMKKFQVVGTSLQFLMKSEKEEGSDVKEMNFRFNSNLENLISSTIKPEHSRNCGDFHALSMFV